MVNLAQIIWARPNTEKYLKWWPWWDSEDFSAVAAYVACLVVSLFLLQWIEMLRGDNRICSALRPCKIYQFLGCWPVNSSTRNLEDLMNKKMEQMQHVQYATKTSMKILNSRLPSLIAATNTFSMLNALRSGSVTTTIAALSARKK